MMDRTEYNKIYYNGIKHIDCAKLLAANNMFGFAVSHLILGIEELIKYQVVMTKSVNNYDFENVIDPTKRKSIFKDHLTKHDLLREFQESISTEFADKFMQCIFERTQNITPSGEYDNIQKNRFKEWGAFFALAGSEMNIPEEKRGVFFDWLKNANDAKNNGFYANWLNGVVVTPESTTSSQYEDAFIYADSILKQTTFMKSVDLSEDDFNDLMNQEVI